MDVNMLALIRSNEIVSHHLEGTWVRLPDGTHTSPAQDGWANGNYRLATIQPADPVPEGKRVASTTVELIEGQPKYVHALEDEPAPPVPQEISRRQFYQGLAVAEFITNQEALAAITGTLPTALQAVVDSLPDADDQFNAAMLLKGAATFERSHPLVAVFAVSQELSETEVDDFWRLCASLV